MTVGIEVSRTIARPCAEVAAYAMNPINDPHWIGGIRDVEMLTPPPLAKGSRVARGAFFLGRRIDYVLKTVELTPGALLAMRSVSGPFPMQVTYRFAEAPEGTEMRIAVAGDTGRMFWFAAPFMNWMVRRNVGKDLAALKLLLERKA